MRTFKNIIFDFGCVLVDLDKDRCVNAFKRIGAESVARYVDECRQEDLFLDLELGRIDTREFCNAVRRKAPECVATDGAICDAWNSLLAGIPQRRLLRLLELRKSHRLFLLSNTNPIHWEKAVRDFFPCNGHGVDDYFEGTYLSYEMHMVKPASKIFQKMLFDARISADETLFIDDSPMNCASASQLEITTRLVSHGDEWLENQFLGL